MKCALLILLATGLLPAQVSFDRILHARDEPQNWLTYSGTTFGQRHSLLTQITPDNVDKLELQWVFQARSLEKFEATPLVVNGVLYTVQPPNDVFALDAATGRIFWTYAYNPSPKARTCCGRVNRGLAILGDTLFMGTIDAHLIALDAKTGQPIWNTTVADAGEFYSITHAPLIVKDKVIIGTAGGDIGVARIHRRLRRAHRQGGLAFPHRPGARRTRSRNVGGRFLEARRSGDLEHRLLRSGNQPDLLGHREPRTGLGWPRTRRRQSL